MLILMRCASTQADLDRVLGVARGLGSDAEPIDLDDRRAVLVGGYDTPPHADLFETLPGVLHVLPMTRPLRHVFRSERDEDRAVAVGPVSVGGGQFTLVAGPCAVEGPEQLLEVARAVRLAGADLLRGGAYKPRTSPYEFQGLGEEGLRMLAAVREETGLPVVTEAVDDASVELVERHADMIQIGARNMHNFALLKRVGRSRLPVLLKRGMSARLEDLLLAAEYVVEAGNPDVVLCERGIRTFSDHSRFTLDLSIVPVLKRRTRLPVFVDPSHATGRRSSVAPLARAALAAGADGILIEVHPDPLQALCDGPQSLPPADFAALAASLRTLAPFIARQRETVP